MGQVRVGGGVCVLGGLGRPGLAHWHTDGCLRICALLELGGCGNTAYAPSYAPFEEGARAYRCLPRRAAAIGVGRSGPHPPPPSWQSVGLPPRHATAAATDTVWPFVVRPKQQRHFAGYVPAAAKRVATPSCPTANRQLPHRWLRSPTRCGPSGSSSLASSAAPSLPTPSWRPRPASGGPSPRVSHPLSVRCPPWRALLAGWLGAAGKGGCCWCG